MRRQWSPSAPAPCEHSTKETEREEAILVPDRAADFFGLITLHNLLMSALPLALAGKTRIGWIGAGVMGRHMCAHLVTKGFKATVFSRTIAKAEPLRLLGATLAESVAEVSLHLQPKAQSRPSRSAGSA
jgi:hypothetical protein